MIQLIHMIPDQGGGKRATVQVLGVEAGNQYQCKSYEKVRKKLMLLEAPNVLTISLKRFHCVKFGKLNKSVEFPEILDMAPYVSGSSDKSPVYRLYGVVVHVDTMNDAFSGHYVCYVKNHHNQWFKFNDTMVNEVDLQHVLTKGAYMLFCARCSPRTPRSIRSSIIQHQDARKHKTFVHSTEPWNLPPPVTTRGSSQTHVLAAQITAPKRTPVITFRGPARVRLCPDGESA
ncbi:unnamed protein product [Lactuca saligna]|uniref:USP domain-containing protein n=1 Tax=Lactuca saligna TaxID=75948 RepID=A0AA35Z4D7_LACSI|nr:unnamed protein product [Lactuca saligna]